MYERSELNADTEGVHHQDVEEKTTENELIILVREPCVETEATGELNVTLHDFATNLVKRRLIRKVEFLRAMDFSLGKILDTYSIQTHSSPAEWKLRASSRDAVLMMNSKISAFTARLLVSLKPIKVLLLRGHERLTKLTRTIADKPRRLREERSDRENNLRELLTTSFEAMVITNGDGRFETANSRALDLFGISERNIKMFAIDGFLSHRQVMKIDGNGTHFMNCKERTGECEIKPLNGTLLVAQYTFVANVAPGRSLYRFRNAAPRKLTQIGCRSKVSTSHSQRHWAINQLPARASQS